jgi:PAS domain S-box-containing protein
MRDKYQTRDQLHKELADLHNRVVQVESLIIQHERMEESLRREGERLRCMVQQAGEGVFVHDIDGQFVDVNRRAHEYLGYDRGELLELSITDIEKSTTLEKYRKIWAEMVPGTPVSFEGLVGRKDGSTFPADIRLSLISYDAEHVIMALVRDITERKGTEEMLKVAQKALQESEAYLSATIESIPFEFWVIGPGGCYTMQNRLCRERYGDIIGKRPEEICPNERMLAIWQENNRRAFDGRLVKGEVMYVFDDEERFYYNVIAPIRDRSGIRGIVGVNVDITDRKRLEAALKKVNEDLEGQVEKRTKELNTKTRRLEEFNTALKVLLKQREDDKKELEESILINVKHLIVPYLEKLRTSRLNDDQITWLSILESHLEAVTSPFAKRLSEKYLGLTPLEVRAANLIREGKTSKEIAASLCVSENTVSSHRFHIRTKLGLRNKKINLGSYLKTLV